MNVNCVKSLFSMTITEVNTSSTYDSSVTQNSGHNYNDQTNVTSRVYVGDSSSSRSVLTDGDKLSNALQNVDYANRL
ncbi:hypothetical protein [Marinomonas sp. 2405UD68-3]|uniref:hypothetical protein n=1 Tax=Marinomonas sp. 2405UD68-3 TaxID=3391835 RepID=UPI0039C955B4